MAGVLRILLVAPGLGLQTTAEVRDLTTLHSVTVLSDVVTVRDVYQKAGGGRYEAIHYASHSNEQMVELSNNQFLIDNDLLQIARMSGAKLVFFNSCYAGRLAHYLVGHGVQLAVHTNLDIQDEEAWKFPLAFYGAVARLGNGRAAAYVHAYQESSDGEGTYGLAISPDVASAWATLSAAGIHEATHTGFSNRQWAIMAGVAFVLLWLLALSIWPLLP